MVKVVYTDGACSGNPGPGGWAWAVPGGQYASGAEAHTTNQRMEVKAVLEALRALEGTVEVVSDSTYVVNCFRDRWWEGWLRRGWTNSQKKPVANRDLWEPLVELVQARTGEVSFRWVKGHSGDAMNDLVDALAVEAGKLQRPASGDKAPAAAPAPKAKTAASESGQLPPGHLVLVTGHKPPELGGYGDTPMSRGVVEKLRDIYKGLALLNSDIVIVTGMGLGVEQLAAEAAIEEGIPFVAVLPYPEQQSVWPPQSQARYDKLMTQVHSEVLLQAESPKTKQAAGAALNRRMAWLARNVHEAVIVTNGDDQYLDRVVGSLRDHLGDTQVLTVAP